MPFPSKADGNVLMTPGRARYSIVNTTATWCYHHMAAGSVLDGAAPATAATTANNLDPVVTAGQAEFRSLTHGGLFTIQAKSKMTLAVDALDNAAGATLTIVASDGQHSRPAPTALPFKLTSGEVFKAVGGTAGSYVGIMYRIDGQEIW